MRHIPPMVHILQIFWCTYNSCIKLSQIHSSEKTLFNGRRLETRCRGSRRPSSPRSRRHNVRGSRWSPSSRSGGSGANPMPCCTTPIHFHSYHRAHTHSGKNFQQDSCRGGRHRRTRDGSHVWHWCHNYTTNCGYNNLLGCG